ncbi:MAG TPA: hypothetical protein VFA55_07320, partial [Candidatus Kapabacteria bacterium]|nr:hypothetical protein [Candidatus Kapabacteria bacterium]
DLETAMLSSVEDAFTVFLHQTWKAGAYLADAVSRSEVVQTNAPKNSQAAVSQVTDKLIAAMKQLAAAETGGVSMADASGQISNVGEGIESLRRMKGAQGEALSAITDHLDGMETDVADCLKTISGASSAGAGAPTATIAAELQKIASSVSKKGTKEMNRAIEICQQAGSEPSAQSSALDETEKIVQSLMKSEKQKEGLSAIVSRIENMKSVYAQGSIYNEAGDAAATASRGIKDANAAAACKAIAENCHADAADASAHPFTPEEAIRRAQNIIRDANALDEMTGGSSSLAAQVAPVLESKVIAPNLLNDPSMRDIKAVMSQKGVTEVAFGATADNAFAQVSGSTMMFNASLGSEPPPVLKCYIMLGLNAGMNTTLEGMYEQSGLAADALAKSHGENMNTRADFSLDLKTLGEQEAKRMFRAMPAYSNVADH